MLRVLLPIIKNTCIRLFNVDPVLIESSREIGLTDFQIIRHVRLPNAYPAIFAGIKFAATLANNIAVLTDLIGGGDLRSTIFEGLTDFNTTKVLAGTLPVTGISLFLDFSFPGFLLFLDFSFPGFLFSWISLFLDFSFSRMERWLTPDIFENEFTCYTT
jgi:ABC-type proline/glycine betaine transport system permease subunit